ncbi:MAG: rRNA pseudouridine synthase [Lachnospiraceae bacterium]|nr:rRNA pseudouridine synthase [Lachnospiraceae bacterium]
MSDTREHDQNPVPDLRLNKYIASCGICSRREADRLIDDGQVTVNGETAVQGMIVKAGDTVKVKGKLISLPERKIVVAYYKPAGVTCTAGDPHAGKTLKDVFSYPVRLTYAGRLDQDSEGLLLMTNDGDLIDRMMRGSAGHEKEYIVRVRRKISDQDLRLMEKGIWLKELEVKTAPCKIKRLGEYTFSIVLTQGLNRQIRRMVKAVGNEIRFLKRVRVLTVKLEDMKPGEQRTLSAAQLKELYDAAYERR